MKVLGYLLSYLIAFAILYIDGIQNEDGGVTIGQVWKVPVIMYLIYKVIPTLNISFIKVRLYYAFSKLFNQDSVINLFNNIASNVFKFMVLPLFLGYINRYVNYKKALKYGLFLSQILIISFIPFWLGILEERHSYKGASLIGATSLIGPFNNAHTASIYLSTSLLFLIHYIKDVKSSKLFILYNLCLVLIGTYFLAYTYVRTGYLMFVVGTYILLFSFKRHWFKSVLYGIVGLYVFFLIGSWAIEKDGTLERRLNEETGYNDPEEGISGSGRFLIWEVSWELWYESDEVSKLFLGYGSNVLREEMEKKVGLSVGSHSGYLDALTQNGLIGFFLFLLFYILMFKYLYRYRRSVHFKLFVAWLISELAFQAVQGGIFIFYDVLSAFIIMLPQLNLRKTRALSYNYRSV